MTAEATRTIARSELELRQSSLVSDGGMVTANHQLAAEAGAEILARGGNAIDAAVATAFALGVVEPAMSGIGGRGYLVIHFSAGGWTAVIDGHERAPRASRPDQFETVDGREVPTPSSGPRVAVVDDANAVGHLAVAVPGMVAALAVAHRRYGTLPLGTVLEPAIALAAEGFEVSVPLATMLAQHREKLARFPATAAVFLPGGQPPVAGSRLVQADLARTYRLIAERGPQAFYRGPIAEAIHAEMERAGGLLSRDDLAEFRPRIWDRPLVGSYRGYRLLTVPEATGGITLLQILNLLERFDPAALDGLDAPALHLVLEACRVAFVDRTAVMDDPAFRPVPLAGLASKAFAERRSEIISMERALDDVAPGDPWPFDEAGASSLPRADLTAWHATDADTTHFCIVDRKRTVVSMTQSIIDAFGSGVVVPGTGILLNSAIHTFNPLPGRLRSIAPWKRAPHYGTPTIVLREDGSPYLAIGGAGGTKITTGVAQILANVLDRGWDLQQAVAAPRVHNDAYTSQVDARLGPPTIERLRELGHRLEVVRPSFARPAFSRINGIALDGDGTLKSGTDQFGDAGAAAV